jgi:predicted regulator of Ras-like GTPase activity (Roadblock/LC7/MglB family)
MSKKDVSNPPATTEYLQYKLDEVLQRINREGEFKASILSTLDGFSISAVSSQFDDVVLSALSAIVQDASKRAERYMGFKRMDEVSLVDDDKFRLVCREFEVDGSQFILTVVVPPYKTYRKLTNEAIKSIERIFVERKKTLSSEV